MNIYNNFFLLFSTRIMITKVTYQRSQCPTTQTLSKNISIVYFTQTFYLKGLLHLLNFMWQKRLHFLLHSCARLLDRIISRSIQHTVWFQKDVSYFNKKCMQCYFLLTEHPFPKLKSNRSNQYSIAARVSFPFCIRSKSVPNFLFRPSTVNETTLFCRSLPFSLPRSIRDVCA